jgi:hypothetical protein
MQLAEMKTGQQSKTPETAPINVLYLHAFVLLPGNEGTCGSYPDKFGQNTGQTIAHDSFLATQEPEITRALQDAGVPPLDRSITANRTCPVIPRRPATGCLSGLLT